ncbi:MAG: hypothetical protein GY832_01955 [Chloroflexi bacterium]|nr:hypothetical protein [Chloroflexota bacterium]
MKFREIISIIEGELVTKNANLTIDITHICAADLMSDVLAFAGPKSVLVTGLCNPQVVNTADMADIAGVIFVRGKHPSPKVIVLAEEENIPLITTSYSMFETCGRLYQAGLKSVDTS